MVGLSLIAPVSQQKQKTKKFNPTINFDKNTFSKKKKKKNLIRIGFSIVLIRHVTRGLYSGMFSRLKSPNVTTTMT